MIRGSEGSLQFAHLSVREYLLSDSKVKTSSGEEADVKDLYGEPSCHQFAMQTCIQFLNLPALEKLKLGTSNYTRDFGRSWKSHGGREEYREGLWRLKPEPVTFATYAISYWAEHADKATSEKRSKDQLFKSFLFAKRYNEPLQWWFTQLSEENFTGSCKDQIFDLPRHYKSWRDSEQHNSWESKPESPLGTVGAAFNLPELIEHVKQLGQAIDEIDYNRGLTYLLIAIRHANLDAVKYLLDEGANPRRVSRANTHYIYRKGMGIPQPDEDMVYWVTAKGGNRQLRVNERGKVEEVLLSHNASRQVFLNQTKVHLQCNTNANPCRGVQILFEADDSTPISAEIVRYTVKRQGLGDLADSLKYIDKDSFRNDMILDVVGHDKVDARRKLFKWKYISEPTSHMVVRALKRNAAALAYLMDTLGPDIVTERLMTEGKPQHESTREALISRLEKGFITPSVFEAVTEDVYDDSLKLILDFTGPDVITGQSLVNMVSSSAMMEKLQLVLRTRGSLDGLFTESIFMEIIKTREDNYMETISFFLEHAADRNIFLTEKVEEMALQVDRQFGRKWSVFELVQKYRNGGPGKNSQSRSLILYKAPGVLVDTK